MNRRSHLAQSDTIVIVAGPRFAYCGYERSRARALAKWESAPTGCFVQSRLATALIHAWPRRASEVARPARDDMGRGESAWSGASRSASPATGEGGLETRRDGPWDHLTAVSRIAATPAQPPVAVPDPVSDIVSVAGIGSHESVVALGTSLKLDLTALPWPSTVM